jgi:hypothetical protein
MRSKRTELLERWAEERTEARAARERWASPLSVEASS